jgi:hypothetical protein
VLPARRHSNQPIELLVPDLGAIHGCRLGYNDFNNLVVLTH